MSLRQALYGFLVSLPLAACFHVAPDDGAAARKAACDELNGEVNKAYDMSARQRAGTAEILSYLLWPPNAITLHDARRKSERDAELQVVELLEQAQLASCAVMMTNPRTPMLEQFERMPVGNRELECVKDSGVRVYTSYLDIPERRIVSVYSAPPKGPTILVDRGVTQLPEVVQAFSYERACQVHRQNIRLGSQPGSTYGPRFDCPAIRVLKQKGFLGVDELSVLRSYIKESRAAVYATKNHGPLPLDEILERCFALEDFDPSPPRS